MARCEISLNGTDKGNKDISKTRKLYVIKIGLIIFLMDCGGWRGTKIK